MKRNNWDLSPSSRSMTAEMTRDWFILPCVRVHYWQMDSLLSFLSSEHGVSLTWSSDFRFSGTSLLEGLVLPGTHQIFLGCPATADSLVWENWYPLAAGVKSDSYLQLKTRSEAWWLLGLPILGSWQEDWKSQTGRDKGKTFTYV